MVFDLQGQYNMSSNVGMLYAAVKENNLRLRAITEGMTQEEIDYKGLNNNYNSTAQLIKHLLYVDLNWIYRLKASNRWGIWHMADHCRYHQAHINLLRKWYLNSITTKCSV